MEGKVQFGTVDFAVLESCLLLSAAIGIYHAFTGEKTANNQGILFANRGMMVLIYGHVVYGSGHSLEKQGLLDQHASQYLAVSLCALCGYPAVFCDACVRIIVWSTRFIHGMSFQWDTQYCVVRPKNSLAAVVLEDFMKPWCRHRQKELSEIRATLYSKLLALGFGALTIGLSFLATKLGAILQGVYIGLLLGFAIGLWIGVGSKLYPPPVTKAPLSTDQCDIMPTNSTANLTSTTSAPLTKEYEGLVLYRISWLWYSAVCFGVTYLTGLIVSILWPGDHKPGEVDSRLLFKLDYCLPDCVLKSSRGQQDEQQQLNKVQDESEQQKRVPARLQKLKTSRGTQRAPCS
ncbi:hypothetical protein OS493_037610 [Desmophyllum pertusum]|uniref:Uncharacterized protein n=1 Tax=Desmophyllum pertusum TaxID=174260 RepID=A0A9W9ZI03_9CNID|nr:hypothetical protein OS493_037610 [Desmophyllum pertusum]